MGLGLRLRLGFGFGLGFTARPQSRRDVGDHGGLAVAAKRVLEEARQLGVAVRHLLRVSVRVRVRVRFRVRGSVG